MAYLTVEWGRVGVSAAPDGKRVYALIETGKTLASIAATMAAIRWTLANSDPRLTSRAWYFNWLSVDPSNPDVVYIPNVAFYRSEDGGKTISIVRGAPGGDDYHDVWVDPKNSAHLILGTDQGTTSASIVARPGRPGTTSRPRRSTTSLPTTDFPIIVYGAQQDTGSIAVPSRTDHGQIIGRRCHSRGRRRERIHRGRPDDPNILYASGVYGSVVRFDRRTSLSQDITPWPLPEFGIDINQPQVSWHVDTGAGASPAEKNALYMGTQYVLKTTDGGLHWEQDQP